MCGLRQPPHIVQPATHLAQPNLHAGLHSLGEPWADTTSAAGRMVLTVLAGIAEPERALIQQRASTINQFLCQPHYGVFPNHQFALQAALDELGMALRHWPWWWLN